MVVTATSTTESTEGSTVFSDMLPVDPFRSLYVHFGMLLGVDDFQTLEAYHRGKMWYHSAWLHRQGVIWGLEVLLDSAEPEAAGEETEVEEPTAVFSGEVKVAPGAALDALGRELYLEQSACLNLSAWYEAHGEDAALQDAVTVDEDTGDVMFDGHVSIEFRGCLTRQVPALTEPCDGAASTTAYSRVVETVKLCLHPGPAPEWRTPGALPFHRVRLLLGLEAALEDESDPGTVIDDDQAVLDARAEILATEPEERAAECLKWLRHFAVLDEMAMAPEQQDPNSTYTLFPEGDPAPVYLANLNGLRLHENDGQWQLIAGEVDNFIRPFHIPTSTIQELVCGAVPAAEGTDLDVPDTASRRTALPRESADAGGPRVKARSVQAKGEVIRFKLEGPPLMKASVDARGVSVTAFDTRDGWITLDVKSIVYDERASQVTVELRNDPGRSLVRLIVRGTGPYPFLGRNRVPLAGATDEGAGSKHDGHDFVLMLRARS